MNADGFPFWNDFQSVARLGASLYPLKVSSIGHDTQVFDVRVGHVGSFQHWLNIQSFSSVNALSIQKTIRTYQTFFGLGQDFVFS